MATARDSDDVRDADHLILRRFVAARAAGDRPAAALLWHELLTRNFDRLRNLVYLESHGRLSPQEQDDALQLAAIRMMKVLTTEKGFLGSSKGEWIALAKRVVHGACVDTQRREQRHSEHRALLHGADEEGRETYTRAAYEAIVKATREREDELETDAELHDDGRDFLAWALPQLSPSHRAMIECDLAGLTIDETTAKLNRRRDAVYKLRERAMDALRKLRKEYEA